MGKIRDFFKDLIEEQKIILKKYLLTFILIAVVTLIMVFAGFTQEYIQEFYISVILTAVLVFAIESWTEFKWYRIPMYIIAFILSTGAKEILKNSLFDHKLTLLIIGLYFVAIILAFYIIIKKSKLSVSEYLNKVVTNNIIFGIATSVIQLGIMFIVMIMTVLFFKDINYDIYLKAEILLMGLIMFPGEILCLLNTKYKVLKPMEILMNFIVLPIVLIADLIIYIYFIKILIIREIPSNQIFSIIAGLFIFAFPTWVMINHFKDENKFAKVNAKILPYSFIPLILMQIYAIDVRIVESGFTPTRYFGVALVVFETFTVILTLIKNQKYLVNIFIIAAVLSFIGVCVPGINILDVSWKSQLNRLTSMYKEDTSFEELDKETKQKVLGAYRYLYLNQEDGFYIPEYARELKKYDNSDLFYGYESHEDEDVYLNISSTDDIPIAGFSKIKKLDYSHYNLGSVLKIEDLDFEEFKIFQDNSINEIVNDKLIDVIKDSIEKDDIENSLIEINEEISFFIQTYSLHYSKKEDSVMSIQIDGYMLMK